MTAQYCCICVHDIPPDGVRLATAWEGTLLQDVLGGESQIRDFSSPLHLEVSCMPAGGALLLEGTCRVAVVLECVRCLAEFPYRLQAGFRYLFWPSHRHAGPDEKELHGDDLEVAGYDGDSIDLRPLVREQVLLHLPLYPHCSDACAGLCPRCGANLNRGACTCGARAEAAASPFAVLQALKK